MDSSVSVAAYYVKVGIYCKLNAYLKIRMCLRSRSFFDFGQWSLRFRYRQHFQTSSPQKPLGQSVKFHVDPPLNGGMKICSNAPASHMTNMATMPMYGKKLKKSSSLELSG